MYPRLEANGTTRESVPVADGGAKVHSCRNLFLRIEVPTSRLIHKMCERRRGAAARLCLCCVIYVTDNNRLLLIYSQIKRADSPSLRTKE